MSKETVLILGAKSDIAMSTAHFFAKAGYDLQFAARKVNTLDQYKSDFAQKYQINVTLHEFDALKKDSHKHFANSLPQLPNVIVCAVGFSFLLYDFPIHSFFLSNAHLNQSMIHLTLF